MANKQTAVEWLENVLISEPYSEEDFEHNEGCWEQAKQMEKEQIREAYYRGVRDEWEGAGRDFEDFYKETYGKE